MKKRLFALTALMLCVVMALSSCALFTRTIKFKNFVDQDYEVEIHPTPTSFKKLDFGGSTPKEDDSYDRTRYYSDMVILSASNISTGARTTTTVYNMATDKVIWSGTDSMTEAGDERIYVSHDARSEVFYIDGEHVALAIVETETEIRKGYQVTKTVYDVAVFAENGEKVVELKDVNKSAVNDSIWARADLFSIQNKVYRVLKDGSVKFAFDWSDARKMPSLALEKAGDFYVEDLSRSSKGFVMIYDNELNPTATYAVPSYDGKTAIEMGFHAYVLANGNVLVQYNVLQDAMAKKYTYLSDGEKYNLYSFLIEAKNGKVKELDLDYRIIIVRNGFETEENGIGEKVENMAIAYPVKDQRIDRGALAAKVLSLKNNGRVAGVLDVPVASATLENGFYGIADNRWEFETIDGRKIIVDEKGTVLAEDFNVSNRNTEYFVVSDRIYDWNFDVKYDLTEENDTMLYVMNHSVLFKTKNGETKLYANGEVKTVISEAESKENKRTLRRLCGGAYMIIDVTSLETKYEIYNDLGELLGTITDNVSVPELYKVTEDGIILLSAKMMNNTTTNYYRLG